jgi:DNA N-6-adenine-methyltransferase (Dam)
VDGEEIDNMVALVKPQDAFTPQGNNEWYTPARYVNAARDVMGGVIDLDPASCELANRAVQAGRYYTKEENGLLQPWYGNVWLNCPFVASEGDIPVPQFTWARKLLQEYEQGHVKQAIMLLAAGTKQKWFHRLWAMHEAYMCFNDIRLCFDRPGKVKQQLRDSTCSFYLGPNEQAFISIFSQFGTIAKRVSPVQERPRTLWEVQP